MRIIEKAKYKVFLEKSKQHTATGDWALKEKSFDAAITNYSIALINLLDALSVNRFGKDLSSDNHEAAPINLNKMLNGMGIVDFKSLTLDCIEILKMKNVASYRSEPLTLNQAKRAQQVIKKIRIFVEAKIDEKNSI